VAKIQLVEDDFSLRDIYSARLMAEGYDVVTASDGEEALAIAVRERPDLIILDVMMPKISGFDVLDILRQTPETKSTKVIMMTALSQDTDRQRGESLGVNKYLVKSQVTLEEVVTTVKGVLGGSDASADPAAVPADGATPSSPTADATPKDSASAASETAPDGNTRPATDQPSDSAPPPPPPEA
jgi:DNA-binding response OmpR family regulator